MWSKTPSYLVYYKERFHANLRIALQQLAFYDLLDARACHHVWNETKGLAPCARMPQSLNLRYICLTFFFGLTDLFDFLSRIFDFLSRKKKTSRIVNLIGKPI